MKILNETLGLEGWSGGVIPATDASLLGPAASPHGQNSALALATTGVPYVQKRMGLRCVNATPIPTSPAIIGQFDFYHVVNNVHYHLIVANNGKLYKVLADGTMVVITAADIVPPEDLYPSFAVMNDLCFIVDGLHQTKTDGVNIFFFGIDRPEVMTLAGAAGAAGSPNGTYELRMTYANSSTGAESSASNTAGATVTVASQQITVTDVTISADPQVDTRYIYTRNINTQTLFYRAGTIHDNTSTSITLDFIDANLIIIAPGLSQNDPPPQDGKFATVHQGRMFVASNDALYYSAINQPEAFAATNIEYVDKNAGQPITGLISDHEILIIFKEDRVYGLFNGNDPASWQIRLISSDFGCAAHRTIRSCQGWTFWWSRHGLVRWDGSSPVDDIGLKLYGDPSDRVNYLAIARASACYDPNNARYLVALPETFQDRATMILPFNVQMGVFESDRWDPMDAASLGEAVDANNVIVPFLGGYMGQLFQVWIGNNDGVAASTTALGSFVQSGITLTTITDADATFDTTGAGLIERKVTLLDADGNVVDIGSPRPRIVSNTATTVTLSSTLHALVDGATYYYVIGGPNFEWDTTWRYMGLPWVKKRYEYAFINFKGVARQVGSRLGITFDWNSVSPKLVNKVFASSATVGLWDDPDTVWDTAVWDMDAVTVERFRVARVGRAYQIRVHSPLANQPFAILYLGMQAVAETTKN